MMAASCNGSMVASPTPPYSNGSTVRNRSWTRSGHARMDAAVAHDTLPPQAEMETLLRASGFVPISVRDEPGRYVPSGRKAP